MAKQCGECSLCCKILEIYELAKPAHQWCPHVRKRSGCTCYADRPQSCRNFRCLWLVDDLLGEDWKPNKSKFVIAVDGPTHVVVHADRGASRPWAREPYLSALREMSSKGIAAGGMLTVVENGETIVILPDRGVNVGKLLPDDRVAMGARETPDGISYEVGVVKADRVPPEAVGVGWTKRQRF